MKNLIKKNLPHHKTVPPTRLKSDESTGEKPMELFTTDEHTEHYLSLRLGSDTNRGAITGVLSVGTFFCLALAVCIIVDGNLDGIWMVLSLGAAMFIIPCLWESSQKIPLPIILNRRTREVYFDHEGKLFHTPWDNIEAIAYEFDMFSAYTGTMHNAALAILVHRLGEPETALTIDLGLPMGKTLKMQKAFWEYLRAYMDNGPWFDENGKNSESDDFIKRHLALDIRCSDLLARERQNMANEKLKANNKNYLSGTAAFLWVSAFVFHPTHVVQDFTYNLAKRRNRNRNRWPEIVLERLRANGPTTRLIDLERERGLKV